MVKQRVKTLGLEFHARVQIDMFADLFRSRLDGEAIKIARALENSFQNPTNESEASIWKCIEEFRKREVAGLESELFAQRKRLADAERKLVAKVTKSAQTETDRAQRQIERFRSRLDRLKSSVETEEDSRIFPMMYAPIITVEGAERVIVPMRYHCRPSYEEETFDKLRDGCYNARRDNLSGFWKSQFGKNHALLVISGFFENVSEHKYQKRNLSPGEKERNLVIEFRPEGYSEMLVPCIFDTWERQGKRTLRSFALITDEPPREVAETGHDRCPIFLTENAANRWLSPKGRTQAELFAILNDRERPFYRHTLSVA